MENSVRSKRINMMAAAAIGTAAALMPIQRGLAADQSVISQVRDYCGTNSNTAVLKLQHLSRSDKTLFGGVMNATRQLLGAKMNFDEKQARILKDACFPGSVAVKMENSALYYVGLAQRGNDLGTLIGNMVKTMPKITETYIKIVNTQPTAFNQANSMMQILWTVSMIDPNRAASIAADLSSKPGQAMAPIIENLNKLEGDILKPFYRMPNNPNNFFQQYSIGLRNFKPDQQEASL
jgi:hypothetical protein